MEKDRGSERERGIYRQKEKEIESQIERLKLETVDNARLLFMSEVWGLPFLFLVLFCLRTLSCLCDFGLVLLFSFFMDFSVISKIVVNNDIHKHSTHWNNSTLQTCIFQTATILHLAIDGEIPIFYYIPANSQ